MKNYLVNYILKKIVIYKFINNYNINKRFFKYDKKTKYKKV